MFLKVFGEMSERLGMFVCTFPLIVKILKLSSLYRQ